MSKLTYNIEVDVYNTFLEKCASLYKLGRSLLRGQWAMGQLTPSQIKNYRSAGKLPGQRRLMDSMRRGAHYKMDKLHGIILDANEGEAGITQAVHRIFPHLQSTGDVKERYNRATQIAKALLDTQKKEQVGSQTSSLAYSLLGIGNPNNMMDRMNDPEILKMLAWFKPTDPTGIQKINHAINTPISVIPKNVQSQYNTAMQKIHEANLPTINKHFNDRANLKDLIHEVNEAANLKIKGNKGQLDILDTDVINRINKINETMLGMGGDSHTSRKIIRDELMNDARLYSKGEQDAARNVRNFQYFGRNRKENRVPFAVNTGESLELIPKETTMIGTLNGEPITANTFSLPSMAYKSYIKKTNKNIKKVEK